MWTLSPVGVFNLSPHVRHTLSQFIGKVVDSLLPAGTGFGFPLQNFSCVLKAWIVLKGLSHFVHCKNDAFSAYI